MSSALTAPLPPKPALVAGNKNNVLIINGEEFHGVDNKSIHNMMQLCQFDDCTKDMLIYNIFCDDVFIVKPPPWEADEDFKVRPLRDDDILCTRAWAERRGIKCSNMDTESILIALARRRTINPPKEYFNTLTWDKKPRLDSWLTYYLGAEDQPAPYLKMVGSKWVIGIVSRVFEPGCKFDNVLILEGDQYLGKSRVFEQLATINGQRYFTDENIDFRNKDSLMKLQGKLIFEMAELASFRKAETDEIKGFITRKVDEYRPPYGRKITPRPRMFGIGGSVNPTAGYLTDPTGNRRYWPVKCGNKIDIEALCADREQLWAEAVHRYKSGEKIWLQQDEYAIAQIEQRDRVVEDLMTDKIVKSANDLIDSCWTHDFYLSDLIAKLDIPIAHQDGKLRIRITDCLTANGYVEYMPRIDGRQRRKWKSRYFTSSTSKPA